MAQHSAGRSAPLRLPPAGVFICLVVITLTFLGLVALFSASQAIHDDPALLLRKQLIWLVIASFAGAFVMLINLEALRPLSYVLAGAALLSLVAVLIPGIGVTVNGAQRWIDFGPMRLQVSEIGKLGLLFALAHYLSNNKRYFDQFLRGFAIPCGIVGVFCGLIILEPDFGTTFLCGAVGGILLFLAGMRLKFLIPAAVLALTGFAVLVYNDPVRMARITSFLDVAL